MTPCRFSQATEPVYVSPQKCIFLIDTTAPAPTLLLEGESEQTSYMGFYQLLIDDNNQPQYQHDRPVYKHLRTDLYIYYWAKTGRWFVGPNFREDIYWLHVKDSSILPQKITGAWKNVHNTRTVVDLTKARAPWRGLDADISPETVTQEECIRRLQEDNTRLRTELGKANLRLYRNIYTNPAGAMSQRLLHGKGVIFNNIHFDNTSWHRKGAEGDSEKMKCALESLGLQVVVHENKTGGEIKNIMKQEALIDHTNDGCFVCVIMSHGEHGMVCGTDETYVDIKNGLVKHLSGSACPSLAGKPKVFIIQACQGDKEQSGSLSNSDATPSCTNNLRAFISDEADVFLGLATAPGCVAQRDENEGAPYINKIVEVLGREGQEQDLVTMMTMVNDEMNEKSKNVSSSFSTLRKKLFFVMPQNV
ncbi:CASP10 [Branchiostoma lanceolatum]|uniref:CASP10 protein n=1 Tax=Branchiostoma lanceolatum TaxID=7740 RepID=A0A8J9VSF8_BRALA|nr:CASP10 [Branchiostoma lanceolatum]